MACCRSLPADIGLIATLRAYIPGAYWSELARLHNAADFLPLMRLIEAAGAKPNLSKTLAIIKAEMPIVERELSIIAASTLFYGEEHLDDTYLKDQFYLRGRLWGEAVQSVRFEEALIRRVIDAFA